MATFELGSLPPARDLAKGLRFPRSAALYAGGLMAGISMGLVAAAWIVSPGGASLETAPAGARPYQGFEVGMPATSNTRFEPAPDAPGFATDTISLAGALVLPPRDVVLPPVPGVVQPEPEPAPAAAPESAPAAAPANVPAPANTSPPAAPPAPASIPQSPPAAQPVEDPAPPAPAPEPEPARPNFHVPAVPGGPMTGLEQRLFDGINAERAAAGMAPYSYDATLTKIARTRAQQMVDQQYFGHTDPYGYSMYVELLAHFGISSYAWAGENLALNNYAPAESPERALVSLMNSPSHKANILATAFTRVGVGEVTMADGRKYYAMIFLG